MFARPFLRTFTSLSTSFTRPVSAASHTVNHLKHFSSSAYIMAAREWKIKDLDKLSLNDYDKVEVEVEGIEGGKVLLGKFKGQVSAFNVNCSHVGAPLKKGVITPDGYIVCPWHGACWKFANGDLEDGPAPDHLHKFDVIEKDGAVYIKAQEADVKAGRRRATPKASSTSTASNDKVVVVGGGSGAFGVVQRLREHKWSGSITVISDEGLIIDRTKLSKALITDPTKIQLRDAQWYSDAGIDMVKDTVESVDFGDKTVKTKAGKTYPYTKLVLASGGTPKMLPLPGFKDLSNIFLLRKVSDVQGIMNAVGDKNKKIVIVGSSFIGMEAGNALAKDNDVTIIGMEEAPLERVMGTEVGKIFQKSLEKNGAKFYMGASVDSAYPASKLANAVGLSSVGGVKLKDGTTLDADLVILGIGVAPATEYLKNNSAIELNKDGSVNVDEKYAVKGLSDVYALGDIATYPYHGPGGNGKPVRIEHWTVAQNMGVAIAAHIANAGEPKKFIPIFWSALGGPLRYCGHTPDGYDDLILQGEPENNKFAGYYTKGDEVVAVVTLSPDMDPIMAQSAELMRFGKMLTRSDLKAGKSVLNTPCDPSYVA